MNTYERAVALIKSDPDLCQEIRKLLSPKHAVPSHKPAATLTPRMKQVYDFIAAYVAANNGVSPSYDEIKDQVGLASKGGIHRLMNSLEERGLIHRLPKHARAVVLIDHGAV